MKPHPLLLLTTIALSLLLLPDAVKPDLSADLSSLLTLRSAVGGRTSHWNLSSPSAPCSFFGVVCSTSSPQRVTEIHLPGATLSGQIPPDTFQNLTLLHTLSLRFNRLSGPLPVSLFSLPSLRSLYLQQNHFSGPIPDSLSNLTGLVRLNLAGNNFSGQIPPSLNNLTRLATLYLQYNNFSGSIPDLSNVRGLVQFNVSHNDLIGAVPGSLSSQPASAFAGNSLCGGPLAACSGSPPTDGAIAGVVESKKRRKLSRGAIAGIVVGSAIGLLVILAILLLLCRKKRNTEKLDSKEVDALNRTEIAILGEKSAGDVNNVNSLTGNGYGAKKGDDDVNGNASGNVSVSKGLVCFGKTGREFSLDDLLKASAEVLGKGTFGTAYKAGLEGGMVVAVKRLRDVAVPEKEFREKIEFVGRMEHENLVPLRAYYYSRDEKLLVYDYMPMGSLSAYLHGNRGAGRTPLNWETRSSIALGSARGITHLHSQDPTVSHGNIKSSNILLTTSHQPRVSDFGLSQLAGPNSTPNRIDGYRAPEVTDPRKISQKADVYSFGVMLLELLTGKAPTHNEEGVDLPRWVQSVVREEWTSEVFDMELLRYNNVEEEMVQLLQLAIDCVAQYPDRRPSMGEVSSRIEDICRYSLNQQQNPFGDVINGGGDDSDAL
ncbi:probable inactive receptor kinase At1g48480 [Rhododendron vialii]|uniref:probable inactive receptor kinase At1g48480 n=1 Tax=Rhododendron vialii TaxID=182163 RepID=UPI00265EBCBA|nr:probable inactive receptor kinase At1g48480 [Rhododendron vialii]